MFKLTLVLCATLFLVMLIGGDNGGQLRPGLAAATVASVPEPTPVVAEVADPVIEEQPALADQAPATTPVVMAAPTAAPVVSDQPEAEAEVFSLATFADPATAPTETPATPTSAGGDLAVVSARAVNVRSGPGTDFDILTRLGQGEAVTRIGDAGNGWALIRIEGDGVEGYVSTDYLATP